MSSAKSHNVALYHVRHVIYIYKEGTNKVPERNPDVPHEINKIILHVNTLSSTASAILRTVYT